MLGNENCSFNEIAKKEELQEDPKITIASSSDISLPLILTLNLSGNYPQVQRSELERRLNSETLQLLNIKPFIIDGDLKRTLNYTNNTYDKV